jgi:hypothetical protein
MLFVTDRDGLEARFPRALRYKLGTFKVEVTST